MLLSFFSMPPPAFAQETQTLEEVQVSAFRRLRDTGVQQVTLDTTVLHRNVALSMSEILTQHSTLFVKTYGRATESTAEFRGTSPSHTQVLWNGMKINSPMLGTVDFSNIPAYFVDKANLLYGASSLTLTGGGLGGAVDMSTLPQFNQGCLLQYIQGVGSFKTYDQYLRFTYGGERWSSSTRAVYSTSANDFKYTNYDKIGRPRERNKSGYFDDVHVMQDLYYNSPQKGRFALMAWYSYSLRGLPFLSVDYKNDTDFRNEHLQNTLRAVSSWDKTFERWSLSVKGGYAYGDMDYDYSTTRSGTQTNITKSQTHSQQGYVQANADWMPRDNWLLTANASACYNHVNSKDRSPFHIGNNYNLGRMEYTMSISAKWRPYKGLSFSTILREECYKRNFVPVIPALFAEYALASRPLKKSGTFRSLFKASVARNYRYPSMDDLYYKPGGNPALRPEKGVTYDGGIECRVQQKAYSVKANLSAFDSYITDWILWTPNAKGYWQPSNLKKVHSYGMELTLTSEVRIKRDWRFSVMGNYAYTPSVNKSDRQTVNDASYGKQLVYVPRHTANFLGTLSWKTWTLQYQWVFYSERFTTTSNEVSYITGRLKPYYMNNVSLEKTFQWRKVHASLKGVVNNILGLEYVTVLSRPMAGRNVEFFLEIRPQWKKSVSPLP